MHFLTKPWNHQRKAVETALNMPEFGLLFEQGCGKTFTAINILRHKCAIERRLLKTLVVCPAIVVENWRREFLEHSQIKQVYTLTGSKGKRIKELDYRVSHGPCVLVTNYEGLNMKELLQKLTQWRPDVVIVDESQRIKNPRSKRTEYTTLLGDIAKYRYILTGTPILQSPMDLFGQWRFLDRGRSFGDNFYVFRAKFFYDRNAGMPKDAYFPDWQLIPGVEKYFYDTIYQKSMRVTKEECLDLPPLIRQEHVYHMKGEQLRVYNEMAKHFIAYLNDKACVAQMALTKSLRLQQLACGLFVDDKGETHRFAQNARLDALKETLEGIDLKKHKVIIWSSFRGNYAEIGELLEKVLKGLTPGKNDYFHTVLYGGLTEAQRVKAIDDFQTNDNCRLLIGNQRACGLGVNLTQGSYMIYYSKTFNLEDDLQSEARNHRGGSEIHEKITRIDLVAAGSIDQRVSEALRKKHNMAENILAFKDDLKNILPNC